MQKWHPDPEQYRTVQLLGRSRYHLPKDPKVLRAAIGKMIRGHERLLIKRTDKLGGQLDLRGVTIMDERERAERRKRIATARKAVEDEEQQAHADVMQLQDAARELLEDIGEAYKDDFGGEYNVLSPDRPDRASKHLWTKQLTTYHDNYIEIGVWQEESGEYEIEVEVNNIDEAKHERKQGALVIDSETASLKEQLEAIVFEALGIASEDLRLSASQNRPRFK